MVRRKYREGPVCQAAPDRVVIIGGFAGWRGADALGALEVRMVEVGAGQEEVLRAGFGVDWQAASLGGTEMCGGARRGDVDD
jgi:hypothetical protein